MTTVEAAHGGVVLGVLPLATALASTGVAGERPSPAFWAAAVAGSALVVGFALRAGAGRFQAGDLLLAGAVASAAIGYALSGQLARTGLKGWEVISWALVLALPVTLPWTLWLMPERPTAVAAASWVGFAYVATMSQYLGFFAWNAGLALGGIARVSQVQLLQAFVTLIVAALIGRERVDGLTWLVALGVVVLVLLGRRAAVARP
jgi:drug/metabolite transporter (DMT)-like permease